MILQGLRNAFTEAFRAFVRRRTRPISVEEAEEKRMFWAKCYVSCGFLLFLNCTYLTYKSGLNFGYDKSLPKEEAIVRQLHGNTKDKITVYRPLSGTSVEYDLRDKKNEEKEYVVKESS